MAIEIQSIKWMWKFCQEPLKHTLLASGGGSYAEFGFSDLDHIAKHFYCFGYCFLSIEYVRDSARFWKIRQGWKPQPKEDLLRDSIRTVLEKRAKTFRLSLAWSFLILGILLAL